MSTLQKLTTGESVIWKCLDCGGEVMPIDPDADQDERPEHTCPPCIHCKGSGRIAGQECPDCGGTGKKQAEK